MVWLSNFLKRCKLMKKYLVTTADERTWVKDQPMLFLGIWCKKYSRKSIWSNLDITMAQPIGVEPEENEKNLNYVQSLTSKILSELTIELNKFHKTNLSERYWNILLGHWLIRYVEITFNRYEAIRRATENYNLSGTTLLSNDDVSLVVANSLDFMTSSNDDLWNHFFYSKIIKYIGGVELKTTNVTLPDFNKNPIAAQSTLKQKTLDTLGWILSWFTRDTDAFFINSYIPKIQDIKLQFSLGQCPQWWKSPPLDTIPVDKEARKKFKLENSKENNSNFEIFLRSEIGQFIPVCYFEGYKNLILKADQLPWPRKPRFIFTSNNFDTDELFKAWTASKTEKGTPYFIGQHGNHYGTLKGYNSWPEVSTGDKFLTWGWSYGNERYMPACVFKTIKRTPRIYNPNGGILLIEVYLPHRMLHWDDSYDYNIYQDNQFVFVRNLPEKIHSQLTVRLHSQFRSQGWFEDLRWKDESPKTKIEFGKAKLINLITDSRLIVHSYDSTGLLETLELNIPTMCFWDRGLSHLVQEAVPYYELLKKVGIIAENPVQAAKLIESRWDNIKLWWESEEVQDARIKFCEQYARTERNPLGKLKQILTSYETN